MQQRDLLVFVLLCVLSSSCFKKHSINANALLQQRSCLESIELKDYMRAQTHCELCLEYDSGMPECLNGIGVIALIYKDEEKAHKYFSQALRQNNDFCEARNNLGSIYFSHGDFAKACQFFDRALEINPSNTDARYNSALAHFRIAERRKAGDNLEKSLRHLLIAKDQINKLLVLEPNYTSAYRDLGLIELNIYDLTEFVHERKILLNNAQLAFEKCLAIESDNDGCYEGLGQVFVENGYFDKAFANYFLCLSHDAHNSACRKGITLAFEKSSQAEKGYESFKKALSREPKNALAHEAFCAALFERGLDSQAREQCHAALELKQDLCSAHFRLADHYAAVFNAELASKHCRQFLICDGKKETLSAQHRCREILRIGEALMTIKIIINSSENSMSQELLCEQSLITFGRSKSCTVILEHAGVSRRHFIIRFTEGQYVIIDEGSTAGTILDGILLDSKNC